MLTTISTIAQVCIAIGAIVFGMGYLFQQFKSGKTSKTIEDFNLFNSQLQALQGVCDEQEKKIGLLQNDNKTHTLEIGRLQGINEEKEKKIKELTDIIANRDPGFINFITNSSDKLDKILSALQLIAESRNEN